ncbi:MULTISPECIES: hypothetical protein [Paenibacillus]|uniref:hypothetical protein n=1 Tax=Paenibacillus TaxID=44249 RepID=UPI0022B88A5F|nr:hypothetical protein [Paenibacillus caseinilyticus]MCZ8521547.1 hypothetical protein [Paenibacillus caseinilyticus]
MLIYGSTDIHELRFEEFTARAERRDEQWIDVEVEFKVAGPSAVPDGISRLGALLVCTARGDIAEIAPQDEGRDCEFQFTESEKSQLREYYEREVRALVLQEAAGRSGA